jgi:hypothetical protein
VKFSFSLILSAISLLSCVGPEDADLNSKNLNEIKILFIGNSYTSKNDLPNLVRAMAVEKTEDASIQVKSLTLGGAKLQDHLESSSTIDSIIEGKWNIVIMQGHSLEPLKDPFRFKTAATALIEVATEAGADVFLFETWARAEGETEYDEVWSGGSPRRMQDLLSSSYTEIAIKSPAVVIPIGEGWQHCEEVLPHIELYSTDGSHPTLHGSYLTACIIYTSVFDKNPTELKYRPVGIRRKDAENIRIAAGMK